MEVDKQLLSEIKKDLLIKKIYNFFSQYKKAIIICLILLVISLVSYVGYRLYINNLANKNSIVFSDIKDKLSEKNNEEALKLLDDLIKNGTNGYVFLSYMEKAYVFLNNGESDKAVAILQEAYSKITLPQYYKDIVQNISFVIRMNEDKNLDVLAKDIKNSLNQDSHLYFNNLEMYATLLVINKKYSDALPYFVEIINAEKAPRLLKERAKRIKALLLGYIN